MIADLAAKVKSLDQDAAKIVEELDLTGWKVLIDPMSSLLEKVYRDGETQALLQIGIEDADHLTDLLDEKSLAFASERGGELVGMSNVGTKEAPEWIENPDAQWSITGATRDLVRQDVETAIEEGWSAQHLKRELLEENPAFSDYRAKMIARTEIRRADAQGNMTAYRASGVVSGKEWILGSEHEEGDACDENAAAGVIGIDEAFPSGDDTAPEHPNCVCDVIPVLMEKHDTGGDEADDE